MISTTVLSRNTPKIPPKCNASLKSNASPKNLTLRPKHWAKWPNSRPRPP